ncbi:MAG: imidazolonepropionase [Phycisphaerales bacterium]
MGIAADLVIRNARVATVAGGPRRGREAMRELRILERGDIAARGDTIVGVGANLEIESGVNTIDAGGRVVLPGFVDCHTHACWAGDRLDEFEQKLEGADYLSILKAGGGIMSTVRATRRATMEELRDRTVARLDRMLTFGTTTAEVKTGYGLNTETELRMLEAIRAAGRASAVMVTPTFLGAHAIDREQDDFVYRVIHETLPAIVEAHPGITCDAYCEEGAWSLAETTALFREAQSRGCPLRIHTDQFHSLGATGIAIDLGARTVDHLEATTEDDTERIAGSKTIAVALPISGFQVDDRYAPARALIDAGATLAIATNYNPGSAPSPAMPFAIALACRKLGLTPAEAITASTINAAAAVGLADQVGSIEVDKRADLTIWDETDERAIAYEFATVPPCVVIAGGRVVK